jgi:DNA-binding transcriptional regulator GbsR (MarR family)
LNENSFTSDKTNELRFKIDELTDRVDELTKELHDELTKELHLTQSRMDQYVNALKHLKEAFKSLYELVKLERR